VAARGFPAPGGKCHTCHLLAGTTLLPPSFGAPHSGAPGGVGPPDPPLALPLVSDLVCFPETFESHVRRITSHDNKQFSDYKW
jgi:hypothetical protein